VDGTTHETVAQQERRNLAAAFVDLGPDHPTLCEGWTNDDLVSHLVVREHQPWAAIGIAVKPLAGWHDGAIERAKVAHPYEARVETFRSGPPLLWKPVDRPFNSQELFIHHEDARRGDGTVGPRPVDEIADIESALWGSLRKTARFATGKLKAVGVDLVTPDGDTIHARPGDDVVSIVGRPGEIVLFLAGRRGAADVRLDGSARAVEIAERADLGL
jgi:uncharacterized protein (TIGR03085 family)